MTAKRTAVFAFGSNMNARQAFERCPGAELVGPAVLRNYRLAFAGHSRGWDGAVATIDPAPGHRVPGLVYRLTPTDLARLDSFEGAPFLYERIKVPVRGVKNRSLKVEAYRMRHGALGAPSARYLGVIWNAYRDWGFDARVLAEAVALGCEGKDHLTAAREIALHVARLTA